MSILSVTLGRLLPSFRTLGEWAPLYEEIVSARALKGKTLANRRCYIRNIVNGLGETSFRSLKPHKIGQFISKLAEKHPVAAKRTLIELRDMLSEAMANDWIEKNPALMVRPPKIQVMRRRLAFADWERIHTHAEQFSPPWVPRLFTLALITGQRRGDLVRMKFSDVWDDLLHVQQEKTGSRIALPLDLRLNSVGMSVREAIEACRQYAPEGDGHLIRKSTGRPIAAASASFRFEQAREAVMGLHTGEGAPPSLHEIRSLSEREYRKQGLDTKTLLGHSNQKMTDLYNNDRGLAHREGKWAELALPSASGYNPTNSEGI